jgi:3-hydroxyisobutyrate dehydrogenase-like beta-hydroxyacid dehydrogenase
MPAVSTENAALRRDRSPRVAVLGGDVRCAGMAANLLRVGHDVTVWSDLGTGEDDLAELGAVRALGPAGAARGADVVVVRLTDADAVRAVLFEGVEAVADTLAPDAVVVDTSPLGPRDARSVSRELERRGLRGLDASVSGSARQAAEGTLATHVGGDPETMEEVREVLESWTAPGRLTWAGGPGSGAAARVVVAAATAVAVQTVGEMLRLGRDLDLPRGVVLEVLMGGPLGSLVGAKERRLREQDTGGDVHDVTEPLEEVLAELSVALRYAGSALPALEGAYLNTRLAVAADGGDQDVVALALAREGLAHLADPDLAG